MEREIRVLLEFEAWSIKSDFDLVRKLDSVWIRAHDKSGQTYKLLLPLRLLEAMLDGCQREAKLRRAAYELSAAAQQAAQVAQ